MRARAVRTGAFVKQSAVGESVELVPRATPIVKWAGGKGRLLAQLVPLLPPALEMRRHVEPFFGGGALFFALGPERALLSDVNPELVNLYVQVRDRLEALLEALRRLARDHDATAFYRVRERYNRRRGSLSDLERAAAFLYLNRTCFNGLHRVNRRGEFNVPVGRYERPRIVDEPALRAASTWLQHAELRVASFEHLLDSARPGDFVYLDPPYEPTSPTARFTSYCADGFDRDAQRRLRDVFGALDRRGCALMLSNSDVLFIRELYAGYRIDRVAAPRPINADGRGRGLVSELVIRNY
ncbi:MAG: DNA adenine methylase [Myxococcota bacterium]|nr:DNA adenine methylase [Myxococcota bacterium]MDW8361285.1 DNA adenine methylase [Myxococcales bacterium]